MIFLYKNMTRFRRIAFRRISSFQFGFILVIFHLLLSTSIYGQFFSSEKPKFQVGFEGNSSIYRWANGYRERLLPTFNTTREARRSVVSGGLFSIVSFDNVPCNSDSQEVGTCYSNRECTNLGGISSGICAGSYGTCCVLRQTCGSTISTNNTYFVNPDYPATTTGPLSCSITITPLIGATQLYLEFIDFDLRGPSSGQCMNDTFTVTSATGISVLPTLCGNLTGQSLYISLAAGPVTFTINLPASSVGFRADDGRRWKIRIVQFFAFDACAAPPGCNQWYREPMGTFESFNYAMGMGELINNVCINVCFAISTPNCGVILSEGTFMLPGMPPECSEGYFLSIGNQKYCGDTLNNGMIMVNQTAGSGYASFQFCTGKSNPDMDVGFSLNYSPYPCAIAG